MSKQRAQKLDHYPDQNRVTQQRPLFAGLKIQDALKDLPTLPIVAAQLNQALRDSKTSSVKIVELIKKDQALVSKVLKIANSSYYAVPGGVKDIGKALNFIGLNTLTQLILSVSVFSLFKSKSHAASSFSLNDFWKHALAVGVGSQFLAKKLKHVSADEAFTCGLLHDVGKLALFQINPIDFEVLLNAAKENQSGLFEQEIQNELEWDHAKLGSKLAEHWGLPLIIRYAIRYHHESETALETVTPLHPEAKAMIRIVRLANSLVNLKKIGFSGNCSLVQESQEEWKSLGLNSDNRTEFSEEILKNFNKMGAFLDVIR